MVGQFYLELGAGAMINDDVVIVHHYAGVCISLCFHLLLLLCWLGIGRVLSNDMRMAGLSRIIIMLLLAILLLQVTL